jgi:hypothetical protein
MVKLDLTGERFGKWTVIDEAKPVPNKQGKMLRAWNCVCDCGKKRVVRQENLTTGRSKSCGCSRCRTKKSHDVKDIDSYVGEKYGRLTIVGISRGKGKNAKCVCDCNPNRIVEKRLSNIISGHTRSCGCLERENRSSRHIFNKYDLSHEDYGIGYDQRGNSFLFSKEDYELIKNYTWNVNPQHKYVVNSRGNIRMHRLIMGVKESSMDVDHINHIQSDNRRENLRVVTHAINSRNNKPGINNTSGRTGVFYNKRRDTWYARITVDRKDYHLGTYKSKEDAIEARKKAEEKYFGEYSYDESMKIAATNKVKGV